MYVECDAMIDNLNLVTELLDRSGIFLKLDEIANLEMTDFGLNDFERIGLTIHTYVNTNRCCAKELIMLPNQLCPEHKHPSIGGIEGKEETFRCRFGKISIFIDGERTTNPSVDFPKEEKNFTVFNEIVLNPGDQLTLAPNSKHWFKAHNDGAVISEFSTNSNDDTDVFTDTSINRASMVQKASVNKYV